MEMSCRNHPNECTRAYKLNQIGIDKKFFHAAVLAGIQKVDEGHRKHRLDVIPSKKVATHTHTHPPPPPPQEALILKNGSNG